jgi:hypothetical protein
MVAAEQTVAPQAAPKQIGEWFWRFLALVMLLSTAWVVWIIYQINPNPLITNAAYEAAASARASQAAKGVIAPAPTAPAVAPADVSAPAATPASAAVGADPAKSGAPAPETKEAPPEPRLPPVNVEKLKLSDSIETPIPERGKKK